MWNVEQQRLLGVYSSEVILLKLYYLHTVSIDEISEEEVELPDGDVDVVRVDTEAGVQAVRRLLQPLPVRALQGNSFEQNHLDQVKAPHLEITKYDLNILLSYTTHAPPCPLV